MTMLLYADDLLTSPYVLSALVTLSEKRLPFELRTLDFAGGAHRAGHYAKASLTQRVPSLVDGDFWLSESSAISEYLEDIHPLPPVYPAEPRTRAKARQVQAWVRSDFMPIREERSTETFFYAPAIAPLSPAAQASARKLVAGATELLAHGHDNLFGDWCIADVDLGVMLNRLVRNGDEVPEPLARYARRQWERPSVQSWVQMPRPTADLY